MKRITRVHINNFKFFPDAEPIEIDGKNILLYGENGSGKSSFYWALYTLLESSIKPNPSQIKKYFNKLNSESLVNIHAQADPQGISNSFIKITLNDNSFFEVSHNNTSINQNQGAEESLLASDFLNYRLLQRAHSVKHSEEIDLLPLFDEAVFNYIQFNPTSWHDASGVAIILNDASSIYKVVKSGPDKTYPKLNGALGYPQKAAHSSSYREFTNLVSRFETDLGTLIQNINERVNPIIQGKLNFNITCKLIFQLISKHKLTEANYSQPQYAIRLVIEDFNGQGPVLKPQSFLNEARLSAIALSIRLAIMEVRLQDAPVKILVLDDLMISLDMSNRDKIVRLILEEYAFCKDEGGNDKGHQTFILTHDRSLFTFIKNDISNLPPDKSATWKLIEMYADDIDDNDPNSIEKPNIFYNESDLAIAVKHYKNHDYPAAANYLRKYSEEILCNWLPEFCWKDKESRDKSNNKIALHNILETALNVFWPSFGINCAEYKELKKYVRILLNPLSHADVGVERYKEEIKQVIRILKQIVLIHSSIEYKVVIAGGEVIQIRITDAKGDSYSANYELNDSLYKLINFPFTPYSSFSGKIVSWEKVEVNGNTTNGKFSNKLKKTMEENHADFLQLNGVHGSTNWMDDLYFVNGNKLT
ncbi:AAA family ATPase [Rufibacter psychrotolerans]|uniref:AAA family ATPase n=1 Tax=Rufibacter psychrotolerans TaxID=2812556 RepID=UPI00196729B9|nr:AAA family ATPase [Rufibacter sp. SYSU D00308]